MNAKSARLHIHVFTYEIKILVCLTKQGVLHSLIDVTKPENGNFVLLESLNHEKNTARIIHVVMPNEAKNSFKLGRGHESDLRITDISVSRFHALITCGKEGVFIEDNASKFGTLTLVPRLELDPTLSRALQIGRTIISFSIKPNQMDPYNLPRSIFRTMLKALLAVGQPEMQHMIQTSLASAAAIAAGEKTKENAKPENEGKKMEEDPEDDEENEEANS